MGCVCWLAYCGAPRSNVLPLEFGMTPKEAEAALGEPLVYHSGRGRSQIYIAYGPAGIPGFYRDDCVRLICPDQFSYPGGWERVMWRIG